MAEGLGGVGRRVAQRFIFRDVRPKPSRLAEEMGVDIVREGSPPLAQPRLRSEYRSEPARIILYCDPIDALAVAIHADQRFDMMNCDLMEVHIAHELFHHLEFGERFGPMTPEEVEEAAHEFSRELLELSFHPSELSALAG